MGRGAAPAVLAYLFHRIENPAEQNVDDSCDPRESWLALDDTGFQRNNFGSSRSAAQKEMMVGGVGHAMAGLDQESSAWHPPSSETSKIGCFSPMSWRSSREITAVCPGGWDSNNRQMEIIGRATPRHNDYFHPRAVTESPRNSNSARWRSL